MPTSGPEPAERRLLLAVDAPSLLHRNHHARVESGLRDRSGRPAWALHGMVLQILDVIDQFTPDLIVFGFDDRTESLRAKTYPAYKAGRPPKDPDLIDQLDRAPGLLRALGLLTVTPSGLEADDVSASAAHWAEQSGWRCVIVTSDRDAFAHITPTTHVLRLISGGVTGSPLLTPDRLRSMYAVDAERYLEYAALRGDSSDNIPGVAGIGEKTAPLLFQVAGSMEAVWADIDACAGANIAAALDSVCAEEGRSRVSVGLMKRLLAPGAREQYESNLSLMTGRHDIDLTLAPGQPMGLDRPRGPGSLPLDPDTVQRVVGYLGVESTTKTALSVLTAAG